MRAALEQLEDEANPAAAETLAALGFLAAQSLDVDAGELAAARRRAVFVLASGGDPHRRLDLDAPAVATLARDIADPLQQARVAEALAGLRADAHDLPRVRDALDRLLGNPELAWRAVCCALLAEEIAG